MSPPLDAEAPLHGPPTTRAPGARRTASAPSGRPARTIRQTGASLAALSGLVLAMGAAVHASAVRATLTVDGARSVVRTHAGTVADLLLEQRVAVSEGDLVLPGPDTRLEDRMSVVVQRARSVTVLADGAVTRLRSHGRSALAVLIEAGVSLQTGDVVAINGTPWPVDRPAEGRALRAGDEREPDLPTGVPPAPGVGMVSLGPDWLPAVRQAGPVEVLPPDEPALLPGDAATWNVEVFRASRVSVVDRGIPYEMLLAGRTIGEALEGAGIALHPSDRVSPGLDVSLDGVRRVSIERATPFSVSSNGAQQAERALARTVGEALAAVGFLLGPRDYAVPSADTPLEPGMRIEVVRVNEETLEREVEIPFGTLTEADPERELDDTAVVRPGVPGRKVQRVLIRYENGEEASREIVEERVLSEPVAQVIRYGTRIVWRTVDTPEGQLRYWRKLRVYATSYSLSRSGTPKSASWYGLTRSGLPMRKGIVGINPRVINWLSKLYVPDYGIGLAADTGGGIGLYHIDLGYDDDNYQSWHWWVDAYLLEPLPDESDMKWILP